MSTITHVAPVTAAAGAVIDAADDAAVTARAIVAAALALAGLWLVGAVLLSALRTVVVPRGERPGLTAFVFLSVRKVLQIPLRRADANRREQILRRYAPLSLILLAGTWAVLVMIGFTPVHWAIGDLGWLDALQVSGSSLTTLGFLSAEPAPGRLVEILEALIGLGLVGLLISFLPAIYGAYSEREKLVAQLVQPGRSAADRSARSWSGWSASAAWTTWTRPGPSGRTGSPRSRRPIRPTRRSPTSAPVTNGPG